jgi:hypothetical protein
MNIRVNAIGRGLSVVICMALLSGCAMPLPFQIASWALDGISYLATEKSVTDHGISIVAQKDCALMRVVKGDDICSSHDDSGTLAVAATNLGDEVAEFDVLSKDAVAGVAEIKTDTGTPSLATSVLAKVQPELKVDQRLLIPGSRIWTDHANAAMYYVVGSFSNGENAHRWISKYSDLGPAVMVSHLDGVKVYRVGVGPFDSDQKKDMKLRLEKSGINNAWAMHINHQKWRLASPQELFDTGKSIAQAPSISKFKTKAKPVLKQAVNDEVAEIAAPKNKLSINRHHLNS